MMPQRLLAIVMFSLAAAVCAAQDYGRIDTLMNWSDTFAVDYLQAYHDSVFVNIASNNDPGHFEMSIDGGKHWTITQWLKGVKKCIPGKGIFAVGFDRARTEGEDSDQYYWTMRGGRIEHVDTVGLGHTDYPYPIRRMLVHPLDPQVVFQTSVISLVGGEIEVIYISTDAGRQWRKVNTPDPTEGIARETQLRIDFSNPRTFYVGVNGRDVFGAPSRWEWHRTQNLGISFERVPSMGVLYGLLGRGTYMTFPYIKHLPWQKKSSYGNPVLVQMESGKSDTLRWMNNLYQSLFPNSDTSREIVYSISRGANDVTSDAEVYMGYHPEHPGLLCLTIRIDSLYADTTTSSYGVVVTNDTGRTWTWAVRPVRYIALERQAFDPKHGVLYLSINATNDSEKFDKAYMLLKVTPWTVAVREGQPVIHNSVAVWPNPASGQVQVHVGFPMKAGEKISIVNILGQESENAARIVEYGGVQDFEINVSSLSNGRYYLRLPQAGTHVFAPLTVIH